MQCSTNYAWSSGKERSNFGLFGGAALASVHVPNDHWSISACDESAAFTSIRTPELMWSWSCCPPIRRSDLPKRYVTPALQALDGSTWVYPRYERLAMGGTHSVHIIMSINLHAIGRELVSSSTMLSETTPDPSREIEDGFDLGLCGVCSYSAEDGAEDTGDLQFDSEWSQAKRHTAKLPSHRWCCLCANACPTE